MENASKALIIAGAILLSILIIALGMNIYNSASSSIGKADMSGEEIAAHNQSFTIYEGKQKGTQIRTLLSKIASNNETYEEDRPIDVSLNGASIGTAPADIRTASGESVKTATTYEVTFTYEGADGLIDTCEINIYKK